MMNNHVAYHIVIILPFRNLNENVFFFYLKKNSLLSPDFFHFSYEIQVENAYQVKGIGTALLSIAECLAKK